MARFHLTGSAPSPYKIMRAQALKGVFLSLAAGMIFSADGLLIKQTEAYAPFNLPAAALLAGLLCAGVHDFSAAVVTTIINYRSGLLPEVWRSLRSKHGRAVIGGALFGSILGMGGYIAALRLAGPAYVLPITTLYPAVASVLAVRILKERIRPLAWVGLALCIVGAVVVGWNPPAAQTGGLFYLGLGCAALAAVGWGAEGVLATYGMDFVEPPAALNIYYLVSSVLYLIIFIPTACLLFPAEQAGFALLTEFAASKGLGFIALAGGLGAIAYRCWYISMTLTGVSRAMALNITYALWGILLSALFTDVEITQTLVVGAVTIFAGMFLVIGNPKDMFTLRQGD